MKIPTRDVEGQIAAAIDRVEQAAQAATPGPWLAKTDYPQTVHSPNYSPTAKDEDVWVISTALTLRAAADATFVALNDPAAVLRRCAAAREMLATIQAMRDKAEQLAARGIGHAPWELSLYAARMTLSLAREWNIDLDQQEPAA